MNLGLTNRTALVLGGGGGLGSAIGHALASEGARVVLADVNIEAAQLSASSIVRRGGVALALQWDIEDSSLIEDRVSTVERELGPIDVLVNNTGGPPPTPAAGQPPQLWSKSFSMMVLSVIAITDRVLPGMRQRKWGRIITSASSGVVAPIPNLGISNALRMSLVGWSKTLAREVGAEGITANVVVPGRIATNRVRSLDTAKASREGRSVDEVKAESVAAIALGRYGNPEEYAAVVTFLASDAASYVTGSIVRVDGGLISSI